MNYNFDKFLKALIEKTVDAYTKKILYELSLKLDNKKSQDPETLLTPEEAYDFLKISETTLWRWTKDGRVTVYGISGKRFYKKSELIASLKPLNRPGNE